MFSKFKNNLIIIINNLNNKKLSSIWGTFFVYSVLVSVAIQFIFLPFIFPQYHGGKGMLIGGDWGIYHLRAYVEYIKIIEYGWDAWQLKPQGWGITGFISAVYSFFGIPKPYILIPFFSAFHALGALIIVLLIERLEVKRSTAIFSAIPYLIFPSSLLWVSQILKDVFTLNASLMVLYGLVILFGFFKARTLKIEIKH